MSIKADPTEFTGKRVLVSGGTKGLGRATVDRFNGWSKEGVDRDFHRGETVWERF